jgi:DNA polymerase III sliding clamp (beta) subunit (PCNA family)
MTNSISKKNLVDALTIYKSTFGISELVAIEVKNDRCYMDVNSMTMSLRISFDVDKQPDSVSQLIIEADRLLGFLKGGKDDILGLTTKKNHVLTIDKTKLSVPLIAEGYEIRAWADLATKKNPVTIKSAHLLAQIAKTISPFATGGHHGVLDSIIIRRVKKELEIVGTDGFRIGVVHITDVGLDELNAIDVVVPNSVLDVVCKLVKSDEPCSIYVADNLFRMEVSYGKLSIEVVACPVTAEYPNIYPLLAQPPDHEWELNATDLAQYCGLHRTVGTNKRIAEAKFTLKDETIDMMTPGESEINSTIGMVERIKGSGDMEVNLSLRFLIDAINLIILNANERIRLGICTKTNLIWLRADSTNDSVKTMAVIVPMT